MGNTFQKLVNSDPYPESDTPTFDPNFGFSKERKRRVPPVPEEDLIAAKVPKEFRDYCAHLYIDIQRCFVREYPLTHHCATEIHHYKDCTHNDYILRMKEYERERRLLIREKEIQRASKVAVA